jgi:acetyl-CoA synthetase
MVAVVGSPDKVRTEIVKAFIVLRADVKAGTGLAEEIKNHVKVRLAANEYPREVEFVDSLPMTATGKIIRRELKKLEIERKKG